MHVTFWGTRGSIPVSGLEYIEFGGDTTCVEIRTAADDIIIIDAGSGIRRLGNKLLAEKRYSYHLLFTHAHWDHMLGFPFFKPIYRSRTRIVMYGCPHAQKSVENLIAETMEPPRFPVKFSDVQAQFSFRGLCSEPFQIGSVRIEPVLISHPDQGIGFKFSENGRSFVFLTDNELDFVHPGGLDYSSYRDFVSDVDVLIHDAEYTDSDYARTRTWGHSTYKQALDLALDANVGALGFFHHNQDRSDQEVREMAADAQHIISQRGAKLDCFPVAVGQTLQL